MATAINSYSNETPADGDKVLGTDANDNGTHNFLMSDIKTYVNTFGAGGGNVTNNTLDDYEEGSWTPSSNEVTVGVAVTEDARYTKIGNRVFVKASITVSTNTSSASFNLRGFPFTVHQNQEVGIYGSASGVGNVFMNGSGFALLRSDTGSFLSNEDLSGQTFIRISLEYITTE